jgi:hypothetical protein
MVFHDLSLFHSVSTSFIDYFREDFNCIFKHSFLPRLLWHDLVELILSFVPVAWWREQFLFGWIQKIH